MISQVPPDVLSREQRDQLDAVLSAPIKFPSEFKQWLTDYLATNFPQIPVSQLMGYKGTLAHNEIVNGEIALTTPERTWQESDGPEVTGLADGVYFAAWGCKTGRGAPGGATTRVGPSVNGADPSGANYATFQAIDPDAMIWKACLLDVKNGTDNNTVSLMYWYDLGGGATAQFLHRWLNLIRVT